MVKIILNGCGGRMGKVITELIKERDDMKIVAGIDIQTGSEDYPVYPSLANCEQTGDVVIDFSNPEVVPRLIRDAVEKELPVVIATTGLSQEDIVLIEEASKKIALFRSANMSLGINLLQQLAQQAAKVLGDRFDVEIFEKHHNRKKDSPSGTALMLADSINEVKEKKLDYIYGRQGNDALRKPGEMGIHAFRGGTIVGEHDVYFAGTDEVIKLSHKAYSRQIFATGAIAAAKFLNTCQPGIYNMQDLINQT